MHPAYNYIKQAINGQYPDTEASAIAKAILIRCIPTVDYRPICEQRYEFLYQPSREIRSYDHSTQSERAFAVHIG